MKIPTADLREVIDGLQYVPLLTGWANTNGDSSQFVRVRHKGTRLSFELTGSLWAGAVLDVAEKGDWKFYIDRRVIQAFLKAAATKETEIQCDGAHMVLRAGPKITLATHDDIGGYSLWQGKTAATMTLPDSYVEALPMLLRYCPTLPGMSHVDAVFVCKGYGVLATDTVCVAALEDKTAKADYFLPHALMEVFKSQSGKLSVEADGAGIEFNRNFVYQPLNSGLANYPIAKIRDVLKQGANAKPIATFASDKLTALLGVLNALAIEGKAGAQATVKTNGKLNTLVFSMGLPGGEVVRSIPVVDCKAELSPVAWVIRRIQPWVEFVAKSHSEIQFKRLPSATVLTAGAYVFMMSDA